MEGALNAHPELARALATALLHSLWQCALLAVAAATALHVLKRYGAALRHNVGMVFLLAMAAAPAWTFVTYWSQPADRTEHWGAVAALGPGAGAAPSALFQPASAWPALLCALWLFGVLYMLIRRLGGLWWIGQLERRDTGRLSSQWQTRLDVLRAMMGITRKIVVRVSEDVVVPFTARLFRPVIWMPLSLLCRMSPEQVEALFAHELAHIQRLDWLWNGLQCVVEALLFFHPGVWWLSRRIRDEREQACDDAAVKGCTDAVVLSEALAALAHARQSSPLLLAATGGPLMRRIAHLLSGSPAPASSGAAFVLVALAAVSAILVAPLGVGYAAPSQTQDPPTLSINARRLQAAISPVNAPAAREPTRNFEQAGRGRQTREAEMIARGREQAIGYVVDPSPHVEQAAHDATYAARMSEQAASSEAQAARLAEQDARRAEARAAQASQIVLSLVATDPHVVDRIGAPAAVTSDGISGSWRADEGTGVFSEARLSFTLTGPQGQARIGVRAIQEAGQWRLSELDVRDFTPAD